MNKPAHSQPFRAKLMAAKLFSRVLVAIFLSTIVTFVCLAAERYSAFGIVLKVDRARHILQISCREIPGYMAAAVIDFPVRDVRELEGLSPGTMIDFSVVVNDASASIASIRVHQFQSSDQEPMAARQMSLLSRLVDSSGDSARVLTVGQHVPDFSLISHKGGSIKLSQFSGKVVAITFLYTHCPLPDYCFRLSNNFGVVRKRFAERMGRSLVLMSITFDPGHDQPEVLAQYAKNWKAADAEGWYFLTGAPSEVQTVALEFGMNFWPDEGFLTHSLHTVVLDRSGNLFANLEGNEFTAQQLGDLLESVLHGPN